MKKNALKYLIDSLLFINMSSVAVLGLLLGFLIPKGKGHPAKNGFLGLQRHEWGDIHLYLSLFLMVLLVIHLSFNRVWIANTTKRYFGDCWKKVLCTMSLAWIAVLFVGWIVARS